MQVGSCAVLPLPFLPCHHCRYCLRRHRHRCRRRCRPPRLSPPTAQPLPPLQEPMSATSMSLVSRVTVRCLRFVVSTQLRFIHTTTSASPVPRTTSNLAVSVPVRCRVTRAGPVSVRVSVVVPIQQPVLMVDSAMTMTIVRGDRPMAATKATPGPSFQVAKNVGKQDSSPEDAGVNTALWCAALATVARRW